MLDRQITSFWDWFVKNLHLLQSDNYNKEALDHLDRTVSDWDLVWEIGPGIKKENSLTISPNGDKDLLGIAKSIVDKAPNQDNWEFYYSKQPKENWHKVKLIDIGLDIDALNWKYVLFQYEDNKIEIVLKANDLSHLEKETKDLAADLVLTNLLGEKLKMEKIDFVDIVEEFDNEKGITELRYLPAHLVDKRYIR